MLVWVPLASLFWLLLILTRALLYMTVISFFANASMLFLIEMSNSDVPLGLPPIFLTVVSLLLEEAVVILVLLRVIISVT